MKKAVTLKKNYEFRRVYQRGLSAASRCMVIYCRKNNLKQNRLGLTASVKIGHAVFRNRARRRLRELYRLHMDKLRPGYDVILVARSRTVTVQWEELENTFLRLSRKLNIIEAE